MCACPYVLLSIYPSPCLSFCLSVHPPAYRSVYPSACQSVYPSACTSLSSAHRLSFLSIRLSVHLLVRLSVRLSVCLSVVLSVCQSVNQKVGGTGHTLVMLFTARPMDLLPDWVSHSAEGRSAADVWDRQLKRRWFV